MYKVLFALLTLVCLGLGGVVVADYQGYFGVDTYAVPELTHVRYRVVDAQTGEPVDEPAARCIHQFSEDLCTLRKRSGGAKNEVHLTFAVRRLFESGMWFKRDLGLYGDPDVEFSIAFIHPNYALHSRISTYADVIDDAAGEIVEIALKPRPPDP